MSAKVAVSEAKGQLTELVRRAEAGEDVVLTRHGPAAVKLVPIRQTLAPSQRRRIIAEAQVMASRTALPGADAARSQDFLYDDDGLPR
ncbi:prevent-host-death protein [Bosea sp. AAP35]|uniref:type II toxin-antitoxin system Phd/YefM family antitoxin n=1 Tax=Bosea sp. AAP35 TaxID=1523417 RepID=UPI0006B9C6BE|nr:type II toxin-antitoxin system prevent-host-death family antitoxin [Bosea sp. AAP35]KPF71715.1 prevent-host-death protein [Bosea sp. AAP35]